MAFPHGRRACLVSLGLFVLTNALVACGDDDGGTADAGVDGGAGMDAGRDGGTTTRTDGGPPDAHFTGTRAPEAELSAMRDGCAFERGALPQETLGAEVPIGDDIPINHIILVMQENRSFNHYFGTMEGVDGIPADASNPDAMGAPVMPFHTTEYCIEDVHHGWNPSHRQYHDGANDGFVTTNNPMGERALGYLDGSDLPYYWDLYSTFAMSDHHHCSVLGPTWVNRFYYLAGTSFGRIDNSEIPTDRLADPPYIVFQLLDQANVPWRLYTSDVPFILGGFPQYAGRNLSRIRPLTRFMDDLAAGDLPPVVYIDPAFTGGSTVQSDEHPPSNPQVGQRFVKSVMDAVFASSFWPSTAVVLTYDEHGGFYDHVAPPPACLPGDHPPLLEASSEVADFDRYGFRVPLVVVSPYSRPGYVSDHVTDHTSILRFVETRFLLPALTSRDANAWPLMDMFDFETAAFMTPPSDLADAVVDEAHEARCIELFGEGGISL